MKTEIARSKLTKSRPKNSTKTTKDPSKSTHRKKNDLSSNVINIIMNSRFSMTSIMILSLFVDAKGESLYDGDVKDRFKLKFKVEVGNKTSTLLTTFSERGLLKMDEAKNANPKFQGRGNYRKYYFATKEAEELIEYMSNLLAPN